MQDIWLIPFKASIAPTSSFNMDGSTHITAIGVVSNSKLSTAIVNLDQMLEAEQMSLIAVFNCRHYNSDDYQGDTDETVEIRRAVEQVMKNPGEATWACAASCGSLEDLEAANGK
jgi:hypothetical protein